MKSPLTPLEFLARTAHVYPQRTAVVDGNRRFTSAEFHQRILRHAAALHACGLKAGDRVAVLAPNNVLAIEAQFAPMLIGAVVVMLNTRLQSAELAWILNHCEARVLIADPELAPVVERVRHELPHLERFIVDYEGWLSQAPSAAPETPPIDEEACIAINYTSGTTGFPKGVMLSHRGAYLNALGEIIEFGLTCRSVYLWTLPLFHCNGWCFPWAVTAAGARHICLRQVDARKIVELIQTEGVTHMCGAPVVVTTLTEYCAASGVRFGGNLRIMTAGAPPSPAVMRAAEEVGIDLFHAYGLTETYGPHTICAWHPEWDVLPAAERARKRARQGVAYTVAGTALRVVDREMRDVTADAETIGEVVMNGNNVMIGYYKNPEATAESFRGGWFHSGDLAVMHPDGYVEIRDRAKDIVISGGENISSIEVEKVLYEHPAVLEAAVVAEPDPKWGEVPKAWIGLKDGHTVTADELIEFCRARLAHFKCPRHIVFGPLPRTATGKIRKNELRARKAPPA